LTRPANRRRREGLWHVSRILDRIQTQFGVTVDRESGHHTNPKNIFSRHINHLQPNSKLARRFSPFAPIP
jgi:hypothetical protein